MIHVTQGHEKGIGLEVFLKSLIYLSKEECRNINLHVSPRTLDEHKKNLSYPFEYTNDHLFIFGNKISITRIQEQGFLSTNSLESALSIIREEDILFTLPTSKDQLFLNGKKTLGYTEFLRSKFKKSSLVMSFKSNNETVCLLTDHIPLVEVSSTLTVNYITDKTRNIFNSYGENKKYYFCGINPHSGEGGLLGKEESKLESALSFIIKEYPLVNIHPDIIPADTHHFHKGSDNIFIFSAHDQALTAFKARNGILAANITLGLPFKRISVDHGVAFSLYGKNTADSTGCLFCLRQCLEWNDDGK